MMQCYTYAYIDVLGQPRLTTVELEHPPRGDDHHEWEWWRAGLHDVADAWRDRHVGAGAPLLWCVVG